MIIQEFFFVAFISFSAFVAGTLVLLREHNSPIREMYILSAGFYSIMIGFSSILPATILYNIGQPLDPNHYGLLFHRISFIFDMLGLALLMLAFILPTIKLSYTSFFSIMFFMVITSATAVINYYTLIHYVSPYRLGVKYNPMGLFGFSFGAMMVVAFMYMRIREIKKLVNRNAFSTTAFASIAISLVGLIILATAVEIFPKSPVPTFSLFFPLAISILILAYVFYNNTAFWFITSAKLESIIIYDKDNGNEIYKQDFTESVRSETSLAEIFSSLNLSLAQTIKSGTALDQISFGDKVINTSTGQIVTAMMVVSEGNFITQNITKYLAKEFEKMFNQELKSLSNDSSNNLTEQFTSFNSIVDMIRLYIPL